MRRIAAMALVAAALWLSPTVAAPYLPADDATVLERLPYTLDPAALELKGLRTRLDQNPQDEALAIQLATRYYALGQQHADPRFYGYAEAVLQPWWDREKPPGAMLLLRAGLRQARHEFEAAMADLDLLLSADPRNPEAWLMRAVLQLVRADYGGASASCKPLFALGKAADSMACFGSVAGMTGKNREAYRLLEQALAMTDPAAVPQRVRVLALLGKTAARLEQPDIAEGNFKAALALESGNVYALGAFADFLLDRNRSREVVDLLKDHTRIDALLLRLAMAERRLGSADTGGHIEALKARFAAGQQRGDALHLGDEARFHLYLLDDPAGAAKLAVTNFGAQKEYGDIRILLEAAIAAGQAQAAEPALALLKRSGLDDPVLRGLVAKLAPVH